MSVIKRLGGFHSRISFTTAWLAGPSARRSWACMPVSGSLGKVPGKQQ